MAKTRQSSTPNKKLASTLLVDNTSYDIIAKEAESVKSSLTITEVGYDETTTPKVYNGSIDREISIVPSTGGSFTGDIKVPSLKKDANPDDMQVINYKDINDKILVNLLAGFKNNTVLYTWDGETLSVSTVSTEIPKNAACSTSLVTGTEANITQFADKNKNADGTTETKLPAYLYICTDTHNLFFGTSDSSTPTQLAHKVDTLIHQHPNKDGTTTSVEVSIDAILERLGRSYKMYTAEDIAAFPSKPRPAYTHIITYSSDDPPEEAEEASNFRVGDIWIKIE